MDLFTLTTSIRDTFLNYHLRINEFSWHPYLLHYWRQQSREKPPGIPHGMSLTTVTTESIIAVETCSQQLSKYIVVTDF